MTGAAYSDEENVATELPVESAEADLEWGETASHSTGCVSLTTVPWWPHSVGGRAPLKNQPAFLLQLLNHWVDSWRSATAAIYKFEFVHHFGSFIHDLLLLKHSDRSCLLLELSKSLTDILSISTLRRYHYDTCVDHGWVWSLIYDSRNHIYRYIWNTVAVAVSLSDGMT